MHRLYISTRTCGGDEDVVGAHTHDHLGPRGLERLERRHIARQVRLGATAPDDAAHTTYHYAGSSRCPHEVWGNLPGSEGPRHAKEDALLALEQRAELHLARRQVLRTKTEEAQKREKFRTRFSLLVPPLSSALVGTHLVKRHIGERAAHARHGAAPFSESRHSVLVCCYGTTHMYDGIRLYSRVIMIQLPRATLLSRMALSRNHSPKHTS